MSSARQATLWLALLAAIVLAGFITLAWRAQRTLELGLPPRDATATTGAEAQTKAQSWSLAHGGFVYGVLGTGSMAPYIPAGDPTAIVAYAVTRGGATFADVRPGAVCVYRRADAAFSGLVIHGAAQHTPDGWIMSGLANARADIRMTEANFVGLVARVFVWSR